MKTEKGFTTLVQVAIVLVAAAGLIWALNALWGAGVSWLDGEKKKEYDRGKAELKAEYVTQDNVALLAAKAEATTLRAKVAALEKRAWTATSKLEEKQNKEKADAQAQKDRDDADALSGVIRLCDYWWGDPPPGTTSGGTSSESPVATPTASRDGTCKRFLSGGASLRLLRTVNRADTVARQLQNAQQVILLQQSICNAELQ